ncbi:DUF3375 family protein [Algoriphagus persicinus]|uniref:DUF3375 family protein n=1 Tax=Algoriphagus persicinus TaxID=3108754 RepID=UPI003A5CF746
MEWLSSLKKEEYVGTESKFKNIFSFLKELVGFTNDDAEKRIQLLEDKKLEIEPQIQRIKIGEDIKVFEDFEIVPRFNQQKSFYRIYNWNETTLPKSFIPH